MPPVAKKTTKVQNKAAKRLRRQKIAVKKAAAKAAPRKKAKVRAIKRKKRLRHTWENRAKGSICTRCGLKETSKLVDKKRITPGQSKKKVVHVYTFKSGKKVEAANTPTCPGP